MCRFLGGLCYNLVFSEGIFNSKSYEVLTYLSTLIGVFGKCRMNDECSNITNRLQRSNKLRHRNMLHHSSPLTALARATVAIDRCV